MFKRIKEAIKKNDNLYIVVKSICHRKDPFFAKLVKGPSNEYAPAIFEYNHNGNKYSDNVIYDICFGERGHSSVGFCGLLNNTLVSWSFPDHFGMIPITEWGSKIRYFDSGMNSVTKNVFEYYFVPNFGISSEEVDKCKNVIHLRGFAPSFFFMNRPNDIPTSYHIENSQYYLERLAELYSKYIHLNQKTQNYIDNNISKIISNGKVLAVHVRGTDFNVGFANHPIAPSVEEYFEKAEELYINGNFDKVFLATDDENALNFFKEKFKNDLLYYDDVFRSKDNTGSHSSVSERPLHHYKLGLEVLRDVYTLANCDSLICGLSQVAFTARYINIALGNKFSEVVLINHGIRENTSTKANNYYGQIDKRNKIKNHEFQQNP